MQRLTLPLQRGVVCVLLVICLGKIGYSQAQTLKLSDFAIWGGSASPNSYNSSQGVFLKEKAKITGNIGSNHLVDARENFTLIGNIFSGNGVSLKTSTIITGNITANKTAANYTGNVISGNIKSDFKGNRTAKGKIVILTATGSSASFVRGKVAVPAPTSTNYSGPTPTLGTTNTFTLPILPSMPANTAFDNQIGTATITGTQTITPGKYKKLALTGSKTLTFDGPGNYIFYNIDNGNTNKFVFDFKNTTSGSINIFVIKDARFGKLSVSTKNGNFPSRIYTEVHGDGSGCDGFSVELQSPDVMPSGNYVWLGNIWAPNSGINVKSLLVSANNPHIIGALWSAKQVDIKANLFLTYQAPAPGTGRSFIDPYYPPPAAGKVPAASNKIGAELLSLSQNTAPISSIPDNEVFEINANKVLIEVVSKDPNDATLRTQLINLGMSNASGLAGVIDNGPHIYTISGYFPIASLAQLTSNTRIEYVRPLYPPISNAGLITSQGDTTMRSHNVRGRFGLDGTGVKIGVISDSYNSNATAAQLDITQGELPGTQPSGPGPVQILHPEFQVTGNDEGRAMLQIVHDVAPKSKLAFRTGFLTAGDFAKGIKELAADTLSGGRCDVIVDDITYITEPFLRDGIVAQTVNQVVSQGVTYFSSAGNFGKQSYEGVFNGVTNTSVIPTGQIHNFASSGTDIYQSINLKPGSYTIVLQWNDEFSSLGSVTGVQTDLDLYLVGVNGFTLFGFNRSNLLGDPFEVCPFNVREETNAQLMVVRASGSTNVRFKYIIFRGDATILEYPTGNSSIVGHPNADSAIAVGAMLYANVPPFTPVWPGVASFSSRGGTFTLKNDGSGTYAQRLKPELIGPNGVNTSVNLGGASTFSDGDGFPNFFGTSAAAPHAAAVGALLIQGRKKYNLQTTVKPSEIRNQLVTSVGKFSYLPGNFTFEGGYGYVQADSAVQQIANAKPIVTTLEAIVPGSQNGTLPFQVKIKGKYLTPTTKVYVGSFPNGVAVTTSVSADKTEATATVPAIPSGQNPPFQLLNAPKSPSGLDGGLSDSLYFFGSRPEVIVRADNKTRKYGQPNPTFTATIRVVYNRVDTMLLSQTGISLTTLKLNNLVFTNIASTTSPAGLSYSITPARATPLAIDDPLLSQYTFTFVDGALSIGKMTLNITPVNKTVRYGEDPGEITYNYLLDPTVPPSTALLDEVKALHKQHLADNALVAISGFNSGQTSSLANMSAMASFQALRNARKLVLQNGQLIPLADPIDTAGLGAQRFIVDLSAQSLANYLADPSTSTMVPAGLIPRARGLLNIKPLVNGNARAAVPSGPLQPMINGQLLSMVNGQLKAIVNGQLKAIVNGQLMPLVNGQLVGMVNGQLKAIVNGQLLALVNGQVMTPDDNGDLQIVQDLSISNGQLKAIVNGQLKAIVNGQLKAIVNGIYTDVSFVNGQLKAIVNGVNTDLSYVNGQLKAIVNGQLKAIVNGAEVGVTSARQLPSGQAQVLVDNVYIPISNGQLKAIVNTTADPSKAQLLSMVNGQLMAIVNNELTFVVFQNGQLKAIVNGQLEDQPQLLTNGQLKAIVNGQLQTTNATVLANGQLKAIVNGEDWIFSNGQLKAIVNGQLKAIVNNFDVAGSANNANTVVLVDADDINQQSGDVGGMFSVNMITGLTPGTQKLVPGAFVNANFEVTYGLGDIEILPALYITGDNKTKFEGEPNPPLTLSYNGFVNGDDENTICSGNVPSYVVPASPVAISQLARLTTYTDVRLNNGTNVITVLPGDSITLTGNRSSISQAFDSTSCPGCVTQHYIGIKDIFSDGFDANGSSGSLTHTFRAPNTPGVYYITQTASWEYNLFDNGSGIPDNNPANAIAVVIVSGTYKPYAVTAATSGSLAGNYPITLGGCTDFANYGLIYTPGTLSVQVDPCLQYHWDGNRNYTDRKSFITAIPTGGVSNLGLGRFGGIGTFNGSYSQNNSLTFDGTGYLDATTAGSVAGDGDFLVSAWVQTTSSNPMVVINQRGSDNGVYPTGFDGEYVLKIGGGHNDSILNTNAGKAYFIIFDFATGGGELFSTTLVNDGNWHHIKAERIDATINLYVDGVLESTTTNPTGNAVILNTAIPTYIGADFRDNASYFIGQIDDIRVSMCNGSSMRPGSTTQSRSVTTSTTKIVSGSASELGARETKLYPNPATNSIRLQLEGDVKSVNDFRISDIVGRTNTIPVKRINEGSFELNVSTLSKGVYFITAKTTAGIKTFRFIKM